MRELIEYLMAILNIKTDSSFVVLDMQNELKDIQDIPAYQKYIRSNINYLGMEYMTGFQKFIKLTEMYKRKENELLNKGRLEGSRDTAQKIAGKVKTVATMVEDNYIEFKNIKDHFTPWELKELSKIGDAQKCVRLQKSVSGSDELYETLKEQLAEIVMSPALEDKSEVLNKIDLKVKKF